MAFVIFFYSVLQREISSAAPTVIFPLPENAIDCWFAACYDISNDDPDIFYYIRLSTCKLISNNTVIFMIETVVLNNYDMYSIIATNITSYQLQKKCFKTFSKNPMGQPLKIKCAL